MKGVYIHKVHPDQLRAQHGDSCLGFQASTVQRLWDSCVGVVGPNSAWRQLQEFLLGSILSSFSPRVLGPQGSF